MKWKKFGVWKVISILSLYRHGYSLGFDFKFIYKGNFNFKFNFNNAVLHY